MFAKIIDLCCCTIDGKFIAVVQQLNIIQIFDVQNGKQLGPNIKIHRQLITSIHCSMDYLLASSTDDGIIRIWDMNSQGQIGDPFIQDTGRIKSVKFVNSSFLASIRSNIISIWNVQTRDLNHQLVAPSDALIIHCFPNSKYLISSIHSLICIWRIGQFKKRTLKGKNANLSTNISPNQKLIVSRFQRSDPFTDEIRGRVRIYNTTTGKQLIKFHVQSVLKHFGFTPDNQFIIYESGYQTFRLLNITNRMNTLFKVKDDSKHQIVCDGRYVLSRNSDQTINIERIADL